jgi:aryl-alcohol dehydrogenase-like predicted oxidoreductase
MRQIDYTLPKRPLGKTGLPITRIGCGLIRIGWKWDQYKNKEIPSEAEAQTFLGYAVQRGVNFFDTAAAYGLSERRLGAFLAAHPELRSSIIVATKCGQSYDFEKDVVRPHDYSAEAIDRSADQSLRLLGQPIDLMQIHSLNPNQLEQELGSDKGALAAIKRLQKTGDIRYAGITFSSWDEKRYDLLDQALKGDDFVSIQIPYNLSSPAMQPALEIAASHNIGIIANRPLRNGLLDQRVEDAMRFALSNPVITTVLTGTANPKHLEQNLGFLET